MFKIIISVLVFFAVFLLVLLHKEVFNFLFGIKEKYSKDLKTSIDKAIINIKKEEIIKIEISFGIFLLFVVLLLKNIFIAIPGILFMIFLPKIYINYQHKNYVNDFSKNLTKFIETVISSLKAGLSISNALKIFAEKDKSAVGKEIKDLLYKISLGKSFKDALLEMSAKIKTRENEILVSALITGIETGGNISNILESILQTIRKREELNRELKSLTSQGVLSGIIVGLLPFFLIVAIFFIDPQFVEPLFNTQIGIILLILAVVMEFLGMFFIRKIIKID